MKVLRENFNGIVICLFELVIGILLLIDPIGFTSGIIITAGILLILAGLINCIKYFRAEVREASKGQFLTKGLIAVLAGVFCIFNTDWFIVTFSALTVIYGVVVLLASVEKIQLCIDLLRQKRKKWYLAAISAIISLVCAAIILKNPFSSTTIIWIVAGVSLILEAVFDVYTLMANLGKQEEKNVDELHNGTEEKTVEKNVKNEDIEKINPDLGDNPEIINKETDCKEDSCELHSDEVIPENAATDENTSEERDGKKKKIWGRRKK